MARRVVIAPMEDVTISRNHLKVDPLPDGRFLLANKSAKLMVGLPNNQELGPGGTCKVEFPIIVRIGRMTLRLQPGEREPDEPMNSLPMATLAPGSGFLTPRLREALPQASGGAMDADQLMAWIQAFLGLLQEQPARRIFMSRPLRRSWTSSSSIRAAC